MTRAANLAEAAGSGFAFRNRIINGDMRIDQRNAGAAVTQSTAIQYCVDRFQIVGNVASKFTAQQSDVPAAVSGFTKALKITSSSTYSVGAGDYFMLRQPIEGLNYADLGWGTANAQAITLSFKVYSSLTGTFGGAIENSGGNRSYAFSYTVASANTWTNVSVTIPGDTTGTWVTDSGLGLQLAFALGVGSTYSGTAGSWGATRYFSVTGATSVVGTNGATFYITGVQLEKGSVSTPFEFRPYGAELALCQRYYETSYPAGTAPGSVSSTAPTTNAGSATFRAWLDFKVVKRSSPTVVLYSSDTGASGKLRDAISGSDLTALSDNATTSGTRVSADSVGVGNVIRWHYTASSEL